ncbi:hypothetical protein HNR33_001041 [Brassicibacter mesophilus]
MNKEKFFNYQASSVELDYCGPYTRITWCEGEFNAI